MFNFLSELAVSEAVAGVYYTMRLIRHRFRIPDVRTGFSVSGLPTEPTDHDKRIAERVIEDIERFERTRLQDLSEKKATEYIHRLADILDDLMREKLNYDTERGQSLLEELRLSSPV